jgi:hypothetical protein
MRFYQIGQPHSLDELKATGISIENGIFRDINCRILATDVNAASTPPALPVNVVIPNLENAAKR